MSIERSFVSRSKWVWSDDPALDKDAEGFADKWKAFQDAASPDPDTLPVKPGEKLGVFELNPLTVRAWRRVLSIKDDVDTNIEAVASSLADVKNFTNGGQPVRLARKSSGNGEERLDDASIQAIYCPRLFAELGARIMHNSILRPTNGRA